MSKDISDDDGDLASLYADHLQVVCTRHDHALESSGASHAVIFAGSEKYTFLDDRHYPFVPNPHFVSWVPLDRLPLSYIVYTPGARPLLIYFQPRDYWHVVPGNPEGYWSAHFDICLVHSVGDIAAHLPKAREKCVLIGEIDDHSYAFGIERINPTLTINILHYARSEKTAYEVACIRRASRRAAKGHVAAAEAFRDQASEYAIHRAYCEAVSHTDQELPYGNIIALNEHGAVLHYTDLDRAAPQEFRSFLIDAGARVCGYAADITRTYSFADARFRDLVNRIDAMQQDIVGRVRPGVDFRELHLETHRLLAVVLVDVGLAKGDPDTLLAMDVTSAFFPHGLGHLLGVQVHDVGGFMESESGMTIDAPSGHPYLRLTRVLKENMVLTIEPGLYVIDMLLENLRGTPAEHHVVWETVDWLRPFGGIRIEDDVRVTASGCENLTREAFKSL